MKTEAFSLMISDFIISSPFSNVTNRKCKQTFKRMSSAHPINKSITDKSEKRNIIRPYC